MRFILTALLAVMLALPVAAQDFQKGLEAYRRGNDTVALREWPPLDEQHNSNTQARPDLMYAQLPEEKEAIRAIIMKALLEELLRLAEQGKAGAQHNLGLMYANGFGVPQNYVQAHMWLSLAAAQGFEKAVKERNQLTARMSAAETSKAQRLAREWLEKHGKSADLLKLRDKSPTIRDMPDRDLCLSLPYKPPDVVKEAERRELTEKECKEILRQ